MMNANSQIKFKTSMLRSSLYDYSDAYILVRATATVPNTAAVAAAAAAAAAAENNRQSIIIKNCSPFTKCISEINNRRIDSAKDIDII